MSVAAKSGCTNIPLSALRQSEDAFGDIPAEPQYAGGPGLVSHKALEAYLHEALPAPDASLRRAGPTHDLVRADAVSREKDYLGARKGAFERRCGP